jgi:hypothetical protein
MYYKLTLFLFVHRWRWSWIGPRSWWLWLRGLQSWWWRRQQQLSLLYYCFLLYFYQCPIMNLYVWYLWQLNSICGYALMLLKFRYINIVFFIFRNIHSWVLTLCQLMEISKNLVLVESGRILDSTTRLYDTILPEHFRSDSESRIWEPCGKVLFDTGATTSFISQQFIIKHGISCTKLETPITILSAGGTIIVTHTK